MCGRADDTLGPGGWEILTHLFGPQGWSEGASRDEVRPTDYLRFVRRTQNGYDAPYGRWGLVPQGMTLDQARRYATFNARAETLEDKPMFRDSFQQRRCVILLAGFWEWPVQEGKKTRVRIARKDGKPLLVAELWNEVEMLEGPLESCTIVNRDEAPDTGLEGRARPDACPAADPGPGRLASRRPMHGPDSSAEQLAAAHPHPRRGVGPTPRESALL